MLVIDCIPLPPMQNGTMERHLGLTLRKCSRSLDLDAMCAVKRVLRSAPASPISLACETFL